VNQLREWFLDGVSGALDVVLLRSAETEGVESYHAPKCIRKARATVRNIEEIKPNQSAFVVSCSSSRV
jgi:hypothetical protein